MPYTPKQVVCKCGEEYTWFRKDSTMCPECKRKDRNMIAGIKQREQRRVGKLKRSYEQYPVSRPEPRGLVFNVAAFNGKQAGAIVRDWDKLFI